MTLATVNTKTIVVGVTDTGHRCNEDHHNYMVALHRWL